MSPWYWQCFIGTLSVKQSRVRQWLFACHFATPCFEPVPATFERTSMPPIQITSKRNAVEVAIKFDQYLLNEKCLKNNNNVASASNVQEYDLNFFAHSLSHSPSFSLSLSLPPLPHPISFLFYPVTLYLFLTFLPMCNSSIVVFFFLRYIESNIRCHSQFNLVSVLCYKIQFLASTENRTRDGWVCSRTLPLSYAIPHIEAN